MSVYSYVELKVHTNVRKVGTHLNVWYIERMFAESTHLCLYERSIYIMNIPLPALFPPFSIIYYIYIQKWEHSFPHLPFPATFFLHLCLSLYPFIIYTLYIERSILSRNFPILLLYSLYIENDIHFARPFFTSYKVNTFSTATFFIFLKCYLWGKFAGKSF